MQDNIHHASWVKPIYKARAFWLNNEGVLVDRGLYEFWTRTQEDDPNDFMWLIRQLDEDGVCLPNERMAASDLRYEYLPGNVVIGRDPVLGIIRLLLANAS